MLLESDWILIGEGNELCVKFCIYIYCYRLFYKNCRDLFCYLYTTAVGQNKQKNEKTSYRIRPVTSVSLLLTPPCTAQLRSIQQYIGTWNTSFVPHHFKYKAHSDNWSVFKHVLA
jgi:hypothetical protein